MNSFLQKREYEYAFNKINSTTNYMNFEYPVFKKIKEKVFDYV